MMENPNALLAVAEVGGTDVSRHLATSESDSSTHDASGSLSSEPSKQIDLERQSAAPSHEGKVANTSEQEEKETKQSDAAIQGTDDAGRYIISWTSPTDPENPSVHSFLLNQTREQRNETRD